ncbi:Gti1/Pac2 family-domain-containing protein [Mycena galopus ATCC 62051]|nr:Gti1/Pac2 family-domain-containing protein [Mycena galopus ATCC 62051]
MAPPDRGAPPPWSGWIETTGDALLILEAARRGLIPRVTRRLVDGERGMIASGSVFVFNEDESGIKRWTDGFFWSPSRILGNFLLYRETDKKGAGHSRRRKSGGVGVEGEENEDGGGGGGGGGAGEGRRTLVGSLTNSYKFKADGLMKKTFSLTIGGVPQHLISYYKVSDVEAGRLRAPSTLPELASLDISPTLLDRGNFRCPPKLEILCPGSDSIHSLSLSSRHLSFDAAGPASAFFFSRLSTSIAALVVMLARCGVVTSLTRPRWHCPASVYVYVCVCWVLDASARVPGGSRIA